MTSLLACPQCRQMDQVANIPVMFAGERRPTATTGMTSVPGVGGVTIIPSTQSGSRLSLLGHQLAPPSYNRHNVLRILGVLLTFILLFSWIGALGGNYWPGVYSTAFCAAVFAIALIIGWARRERRRPVTDAATHAWDNALICFRCSGAFFKPGALPPEVSKDGLIPLQDFRPTVTAIGSYLADVEEYNRESRNPAKPSYQD